jgi:hypothetical protein
MKVLIEFPEFRSFSKKLKLTWKRFRSLVIVYLIFVGLLVWSHYDYPRFVYLFENRMNWPKGFTSSWQSSLFQDLLFFGFTGFLGLVLSTRLPSEEKYKDRVEAIANALNVGDRVKNYVSDEIKQLTVYHAKSETRLTLDEVFPIPDSDFPNLIGMFCERTYEMTNMCADEVRNLRVNARILPGPSYKDNYGYLKELSYFYRETGATKNILSEGIVKLDPAGFHHVEPVTLVGNGVVTQKFKYGIYCPADGDKTNLDHCFETAHPFFTEKYTLILKNTSKETIYYEYSYPDRLKVKPGQPQTLIRGTGILRGAPSKEQASIATVADGIYMHRADRFSLYLHTADTG